jgi:hypothetical protein
MSTHAFLDRFFAAYQIHVFLVLLILTLALVLRWLRLGQPRFGRGLVGSIPVSVARRPWSGPTVSATRFFLLEAFASSSRWAALPERLKHGRTLLRGYIWSLWAFGW